ncbi:hypothetical protein [Butyrivibrio proteoclasticus]|uniref:hypothetical protein n=1 Tax=Butyrivibrio proteoclasticus TaxID=43305 RepID=UPI00047BADCA|nr:hypothetical protein [Butyrivibrio proteoclasticus]
MLKKYKYIIVVIVIISTLVGCTFNSKHAEYISYIRQYGPNELSEKYYYHYVRKEPYFYSVLARFDVDIMEDYEIYVLDNPDNQRIDDYYGFDSGVYFIISEYKKFTDKPNYYEYTLLFHDNESEQDQTIICSEEEIIFDKSKDGLRVKVADKYYFLEENAGEYSLEETSAPDEDETPQYESILEIEAEDGVKAVFSKKYREVEYKYQIGDKTGTIDALDSKYAPKSALSDNYVVEDGKVIGIVQYANLYFSRFDEAKNHTEYKAVKGEVLYEFDLQTCESKILYRIRGNKKLIIGYKNGLVYLYSKGNVIEHSLDSGEENVIYKIEDNPEEQMSFNWIGNTLIIFDEHNYVVVGSVKVEN